jgi:lysozyme
MDQNRLFRMIEENRPYNKFPYICSSGESVIGIGRPLCNGVRYSEARFMLKNDIDQCRWDLQKIFIGQFDILPDLIQEVLLYMSFHLGLDKFQEFKKFINAIKRWDFDYASDELLNSKWAKQKPGLVKKLANTIRFGWR